MRIIVILITVLVIFSNPNRISAEDKPQRSPELQVLDHFIGTWDHELTIKRLDEIGIEEVTQSTSVDTRKWSAGGTFVMIENSLAMKKNPDVPELIMMITYDPDTNTYPGCLMSGPSRTLMTGIWNERTDTMYWSGKDHLKNTIAGKHRFIGTDRAEASLVITNPAGKLVLFGQVVEMSWKQTRRKN